MKPEKIIDEACIGDIEQGTVPLPTKNSKKPLIMAVEFEETIETPDQLFKGFKRLRLTEWFKRLKSNKQRVVPLMPHKKSTLLVIGIGTVFAIGMAYKGYRNYKDKHNPQKKLK
ncbi:hypothetical protein HYU45_03495 [Candidatus Daviesbacteria bacterium]|nr:hypothetical protein [Candidatus Daviesbacteria bacterium]